MTCKRKNQAQYLLEHYVSFCPEKIKSDCAETVFIFLVSSYEYTEDYNNPILLFCIINIFVSTYIRVHILCET